jgi:hypothetical protein
MTARGKRYKGGLSKQDQASVRAAERRARAEASAGDPVPPRPVGQWLSPPERRQQREQRSLKNEKDALEALQEASGGGLLRWLRYRRQRAQAKAILATTQREKALREKYSAFKGQP